MMKIEDLLEYDPETGKLSWRVKRGRCAAGSEAGTIGSYGYREIAVDGKKLKAHRIAWYLTYGQWPDDEIDHIDRNRANNALKNLRLASLQQNRWNTGQRKDSRSPFKGVVYEKRTGKWIAHIKVNGRYKHLGTFLTAEDAAAAYQTAASELRGDFVPVVPQ